MSEVFGVNQTKIDAGGVENQLEKGLRDGRLKVCYDEYEAAALATASTIEMCGELPEGAVIYDIILMNDALSTVTIAVGDSHTAARYISATSMAAAARTNLNTIGGSGYTIGTTAGDNQLLLTTAGVSAATGTIKVAVIYSQD